MKNLYLFLLPLLLNLGCSYYVPIQKPVHLDPRENGPDPSGLVWGYHPNNLYVEFQPGLTEDEKMKLVEPFGVITPRGIKGKEGFSEDIYILMLKKGLDPFKEINEVKKIKGVKEAIMVRQMSWGFE